MRAKLYECRHGCLWHWPFDTCVGLALERYGEWAESEIFLLSSFIGRGDVIVDAGAHVGTHTLPFSQMVGPRGKVVAIEPQPDVFTLLCANVVQNAVENVACHHALVGEGIGTRWISPPVPIESRNYAAVSFTGAGTAASENASPVLVLSIDALRLDECRLLKLDIEQMEAEALRGAVETLERLQPVVYYEQASETGFEETYDLLSSFGYRCFWHLAPAFNGNNYNRRSDDTFGTAADSNILALPRRDEALVESLGLEEVTANDFRGSRARVPHEFALPPAAYEFYENRESAPRPTTRLEHRLQSLTERLAAMQIAFSELKADRAVAQQVMEAQHAELQRLRQLLDSLGQSVG